MHIQLVDVKNYVSVLLPNMFIFSDSSAITIGLCIATGLSTYSQEQEHLTDASWLYAIVLFMCRIDPFHQSADRDHQMACVNVNAETVYLWLFTFEWQVTKFLLVYFLALQEDANLQ